MIRNIQKNFSYFLKKYSLKKYDNVNAPALFFSLWSSGAIKKHKSSAVVIWRGSDIVKLEGVLSYLKKRKNVYHIAISSYISEDLKKYGIKHKFIPVVGLNMEYFKPCIMGNEIYAYVPDHFTKKYYERYGMKIIKKIKKICKYKINIVTSKSKFNKKELAKIYSRCFCGLRMTKHDGLPNQVIEMGLMGIKSFYNGNIPGSIKWNKNDIGHIVENIEKEAQKIGTINYEYADEIKEFINIKEDWLDIDFWEKQNG